MNRMRLVGTIATSLAVVAAIALTLTGCSSGAASEERLAQQLEERVRELWTCRMEKNFDRKYELMSPDIQKAVTKRDFVNSKGFVNYYEFEILKLEIAGSDAIAEIRYTWKANHPLFEKAPIKENITRDPWVLVDGSWYMKYRTPSITGAPVEMGGAPTPQKDDDID